MDADRLARFRAALEQLTGNPEPRIGIAISGGPDSLALLLLAHEALGDRIAAATVDHGLREESGAEARHVADICADLGVRHAILTPSEPIAGNLQAGARRVRYAALEGWRAREKLDWIATAHHADDQLETMLMRLLRGSGVGGLAAIRAINGRIVRPLLGFRKAELEAIVAASPFEAVDDPSNRDPRFDRARLREVLAGMPGLDPNRLARSAAALDEAETALAWAVDRAAEERVSIEGRVVRLDPRGVPAELLRRLVAHCIAQIAPGAAPHGPALDALLRALAAGDKRTLAGVVCSGGEGWRFSPAPPRKTG